jgi:hypothetical protein
MATVNQNPIILITSDVGATDHTANLGTAGRLRVHGIRWTGVGAAGHSAQLTDNAGRVVWHHIAPAAGDFESELHWWARDGLRLSALTSGTLYIYLEEGLAA